jgi:uncharacterized membrane protein
MIFTLKLLALAGFIVSVIHYYSKEQQSTWCDFSKHITCSKAYNSSVATIGPFSTSTLGIIGYIVLLSIIATTPLVWSLWTIVVLNVFNCYLMYQLYFKLKIICIPCVCIHLINITLLVCSILAVF